MLYSYAIMSKMFPPGGKAQWVQKTAQNSPVFWKNQD